MSALAKLLAIQERGRQVQASQPCPPAIVGVPAGEVFGGSKGGCSGFYHTRRRWCVGGI
jgi:hypothetical protein